MTAHIGTRSGREIALLSPQPSDIDFINDIAPTLAIIPRFGGHAGPRGQGLSVAQHSTVAAIVAESETGNLDLALACLLHDAHEGYLGDMISPMQEAFDAIYSEYGIPPTFRKMFGILKKRWDNAIFCAAANFGLGFKGEFSKDDVKAYDLRMLRHERNFFMHPDLIKNATWAPEIEGAAPLPDVKSFQTVWTPAEAEVRFMAALQRLTHPESAA